MKKGGLYVLACYVLWGVLPIFWKQLSEVNPYYILASRIVWSLIFCFIIMVINGETKKIKVVFKDKKELKLLFCSGIMVTINWGCYIIAVNSGRMLEAGIAYYMNPIFAILIGFIAFNERLKPLQWLSVAFAFWGVMLSIVKYGVIPYFALTIAISFAIYGALKKRVKVDSLTSIFMETLFVAPVALAFLVSSEVTGNGYLGSLDLYHTLLLPMTGIVTSIPLVLFAKGIKETSMTLSGILMYLNPTLQMLVGIFVYNEKLSETNGKMLIFIGIAVIIFIFNNIRESKNR